MAYRGKNNPNQYIYNTTINGNGATYEHVLSIPIYDLSHWHVLAGEAHPKSRAKYVGTNSVYCHGSPEAGDSMACMGIMGHQLKVLRKNSLSKFGANTYDVSRCPPGSANWVDFHAWRHVLYAGLMVVVEGKWTGNSCGPGILD